jgi:hypothetical protein
MSEAGGFILRPRLDSSGIATGIAEVENLLVSSASTISTALNKAFQSGLPPTKIGAALGGTGQQGAQASEQIRNIVATGQGAGLNETQIRDQIRKFIGPGLRDVSGGEFNKGTLTLITKDLYANAVKELEAGRAIVEEANQRAAAGRTTAAAQRQIAAEAQLQVAVFEQQLAVGTSFAEALEAAKTETIRLVAGIAQTTKNEEVIADETIKVAERYAQRTQLIQESVVQATHQREVESGARERYAAALEQLAAQVAEQLVIGVGPRVVGKRLVELQEAFAAVLTEEHAAGRNGIIAQGELTAALTEAAAQTSLNASAQKVMVDQVARRAVTLSPDYGEARNKAEREYQASLDNPRSGGADIGIEERYVAAQQKRLAEAEKAAALIADENLVQSQINKFEEQRRVLVDRVVEASGQVTVLQAKYNETLRQLNATYAAEESTAEQREAASLQNTQAALKLAAANVYLAEEKERLDGFALTAEREWVAWMEKDAAQQREVVARHLRAYQSAGVPIFQAQSAGGTASDAQLQLRDNARQQLEAAQDELRIREEFVAMGRSIVTALEQQTEKQIGIQADITEATGLTLTAAERQAVIANEFSTALRGVYERRLFALQQGGDVLEGTGLKGAADIGLLRTRVDPILAQRAVTRNEAGVEDAQANLVALQQKRAEQQARGALGVNEERIGTEQIAAARKELLLAYGRYSRSLITQAAINERDDKRLLDPSARGVATSIPLLEAEIRQTIELDLAQRQELVALESANFDQLTAAQKELVFNMRASATAAATMREKYEALFGEAVEIPAGRMYSPGRGEPVRSNQSEVDIATRHSQANPESADETRRLQEDVEFGKQREERAATMQRDLEALDETLVADQESAAKAREESKLRDIGVGRKGRVIQGEPDPNAGLAAQGDARALEQQDATAAAKSASDAFKRQLAVTEQATGSQAEFEVQLRKLQRSSELLEQANNRLVAANAALEEQIAAQAAGRTTTSPEESLRAVEAENIAATEILVASKERAAEAFDSEVTSVIASKEENAAATRQNTAGVRRLSEADQKEHDAKIKRAAAAYTGGAENARNRSVARTVGLAEQLDLDTATIIPLNATTGQIVKIGNELAATLQIQKDETLRAARASAKLATAQEEAAVATGGAAGGGGGRGFAGGFKSRFGFSDKNPEGDVSGAFGSSIAQQAKFFLPFTVAFGAYRQIKESIQAAQELEKVLAVTKLQFDDLGKGDQFQAFREGIIAISQRTGETASEVALVGQQLQAAFGGDTARALRETDSAMEAIRISGLSGQQVVNDFTAVIKSFGDTSTSVRQLTDSAVGLQERFGVLVKDTIEFSGAIAPIAAETGFSAKQIEALGAAYQEFSGRAGSTGAENLGRVLSGIQEKSVKLVEFLNSNLPDVASQVASSLSAGNVEQVFEELLTNFGRLNQQQQQTLLSTIGGRRETAALAAIFKDSSKVLDELQGRTDDAGKSQQAFANTQQSLAQQVAELGKQFKAFGIALYDSGIGDALKAIVDYLSQMVDGANAVLGFFGGLNDITHGLAGSLLSVATQLAIIYTTMKLIATTRLAQGLAGLFGGAAAEAEGAAAGATATEGVVAGSAAKKAATGLIGRYTTGASPFLSPGLGPAGEVGGGVAGGIEAAIGVSGAYYAPFVVVGGLVLKGVLDHLHQGMQEEIDKGITGEIGKPHPQTETDVQKLLGDFELRVPGSENQHSEITDEGRDANARIDRLKAFAGQRIANAEEFRTILAADSEAYKAIYDGIADSASAFQQGLDLLGDNSKDISGKQTRTKEVVTSLNNQAAAKLEQVINTPDRVKQLLDELRESGAYDTLFGGDKKTPGTSYEDATGQLNALLQATSDTGGDPGQLGGVNVQKLAILGKALSGFQDRADAAAKEAARAAQVADENNQLLAQDAAALKAQFDAGLIGLGAYLNGLDVLQKSLDQLAADNTPLAVDAAMKNRAARLKAVSDSLLQEATFLIEGAAIGGNDSPDVTVKALTNLLKNPKFTDSADRQKATKDLIAAIKQEKQYEASLVDSAAEKARILSSVTELPVEAQQTLIQEFLNANVSFQLFLDSTLSGQTAIEESMTAIVAQQLASGVKSIREATINAAKIELALLYKQLQALHTLDGLDHDLAARQAQIDAIVAQINAVTQTYINAVNGQVPDTDVPDFSSVRGSASDIAAANKAAADAAKQAADQARQDQKRLRDARRAYYLALSGGDPVKQAQAAQQAADDALADAQSDPGLNALQRQAAILEAQAQRITADNQFASAIKAIAKSQSNLIIAMLNSVGDTVGAANEAAKEAQAEYQQALNETASGNGPGDAALKDLQAGAINAAAQARETALQDKIQHEQFLKDIGQITTAQFIAFLQSLLVDPTIIAKDRENIQRQIYQLQHQLGQDFKFNLPSILGLPTLYESRRFDQSGGGIGYQDNRVINVNVTSTQNADPRALANAISTAIGPPRQFSTYSNRY